VWYNNKHQKQCVRLILNALSSTANDNKIAQENQVLREQVSTLQSQLDWFKRQRFGRQSEKRLPVDNSQQSS
jgi:hypothetical protein